VQELRDEWQHRYGVELSRSAMQRALVKLASVGEKRFRPSEQGRADVQARRAGSASGPRFVEFVRKRLYARIYPGDIVLLDNLRVHHAPAVRELIEAQGEELFFLPPDSPDFSPIEPCWSFVKHLLASSGIERW